MAIRDDAGSNSELQQDSPLLDVPERLRNSSLNGYPTAEISLQELQSHFASGHFTCAQYVALCVENIHISNPYLEAVIEVDPQALSTTSLLDNERQAGRLRGRLHGIPILIKDNIAIEGPVQTTAGSWALLGSVVPKDAFVVSRLREAGAVILGHANMSEWASLRSKNDSTGYSPRGGQTRNPYDLRKTPFGSSSGSAVAVSANLVPIALGTETDTSIIGPASINGVVGIKPTVGLTSRSGVIPISENMDSVGPFGRTVADAAAVLDAIAGVDNEDHFTKSPFRQESPLITHLATSDVLKGAWFGLPIRRCWELVPPGCKAVASKVLDAIRQAGAEIIEVDFPSIGERTNENGSWDWEHGSPEHSEWTVAKVDAYNGINAYLGNLTQSHVRTVKDIIQYNEENDGTEGGNPGTVPAFPDGQPNFHEVAASKGIKDSTYQSALAHIQKQTRENGIDAALSYRGARLDALLFCDRRGIGQQYAAQAGYPIICIPIGLDDKGLPVSLSVQHTAWKEAELVRWASAIEDLWRKANEPRAIPTFRNIHAKNIPIEKVN
ncbi:amidase [Xylariomycetidae sp. FL2044]|nr:amidase [Xylariomycetidae sp. FL2044]